MNEQSGSQENSLRGFVELYVEDNFFPWPERNYKKFITELISYFSCQRVLEVGDGRDPFLSLEVVNALGVEYTVNDISKEELDRAPDWATKSCFDIAGPSVPSDFEEKHDLVFSQMVMEHVRDAEKAYRNMFRLLRPGGVFLNYFPALFSSPFVVNLLLPDVFSSLLLRAFFPNRNIDGQPKFPAHYSYCRIAPSTEAMIKDIGFSETVLVPFWGHDYYRKIPGIRYFDDALNRWARDQDIRSLASYCYGIIPCNRV